MKNKNIIRILIASACILLVPLVAMQFTDEVVWDLADFAVAGVLLLGTGLTYELVARKVDNIAYRTAVGLAVGGALLLVWVSLAVGIIGVEGDPADLMYGGVIAVGVVGAFIAQFQARGMARALFATALAQVLVAVIALILGWYPAEASAAILNGFFVALFVGSAWLFRKAAREGPEWEAA